MKEPKSLHQEHLHDPRRILPWAGLSRRGTLAREVAEATLETASTFDTMIGVFFSF